MNYPLVGIVITFCFSFNLFGLDFTGIPPCEGVNPNPPAPLVVPPTKPMEVAAANRSRPINPPNSPPMVPPPVPRPIPPPEPPKPPLCSVSGCPMDWMKFQRPCFPERLKCVQERTVNLHYCRQVRDSERCEVAFSRELSAGASCGSVDSKGNCLQLNSSGESPKNPTSCGACFEWERVGNGFQKRLVCIGKTFEPIVAKCSPTSEVYPGEDGYEVEQDCKAVEGDPNRCSGECKLNILDSKRECKPALVDLTSCDISKHRGGGGGGYSAMLPTQPIVSTCPRGMVLRNGKCQPG